MRHTPRAEPGTFPAALLAIGVHAALFIVLLFSLRWQTRSPEPVVVELWNAPPMPVVRPAPPAPPPPPAPPKVEPPPLPVVKPPPPPPPETKAPPKPDIAIDKEKKAREEKEKKAREEKDRAEKKLREEKAKAEAAAREEEREEQDRAQARRDEAERMRRQLEQDSARLRDDQLKRDQAALKAEQDKRAAEAKAAQAAAAAASKERATWVDAIRAKIRGNVVIPDGLTGNPEAVFDVVQLPTGDVVTIRLKRSSGNKAYDDALERAIQKSTPLPRPPRPELFERQLELKFRPND